MRTAGTIMVAAVAAFALGACSPSKEEPSDLPPGAEPSSTLTAEPSGPIPPPGSAEGSASHAPGDEGPECTAEDIQVTGDYGIEPEITLPQGSCAPPKELIVEDLHQGDGAEAGQGADIEVSYKLVTWSDGQVKDNSFADDRTLPVANLGQATVIDGWNEGLIGMKQGGRRLLVIPPELGYGPQGKSEIAPGETLVFVVDLVSVSP